MSTAHRLEPDKSPLHLLLLTRRLVSLGQKPQEPDEQLEYESQSSKQNSEVWTKPEYLLLFSNTFKPTLRALIISSRHPASFLANRQPVKARES